MTVSTSDARVLITPDDLEPVADGHTIVGVFNPAATRHDGEVLMLVRVAEAPAASGPGMVAAPRIDWSDSAPRWVTDIFDARRTATTDPRVLEFANGRVRLPHISHLRLVRMDPDGLQVREVVTPPDLLPQEPWEELGIEDPRITKIRDTYFITYVAISRHLGITTALMTTRDFHTFVRHGVIFPTENKDVVLLPDTWEGNYVAYHRPTSHSWVSAPSITSSLSPDATHWGRHDLVFGPRSGHWDSHKVGAGAPPVKVPQGWLLIYHGVAHPTPDSPIGRYCAGAVLLDAENPRRVLARSTTPLLQPERPYELSGYVPNVIFPTGAVLSADEESIHIFSGAADRVTTTTRIAVPEILSHLGVP